MKVFAAYSGKKVELVRVWMESWERRGWSPRLLSTKEIQEAGSIKLAAKARGGGLLADLLLINFDYPSRGRMFLRLRATKFDSTGWKGAPIVRFPSGTTEDTIRGCGRCL